VISDLARLVFETRISHQVSYEVVPGPESGTERLKGRGQLVHADQTRVPSPEDRQTATRYLEAIEAKIHELRKEILE